MTSNELNENNYRRISYVSWALSVPLLLIFSWPYFFLSDFYSIHKMIAFPGSILFGLPFMLTILHGHVTLALGAAHRHHYYNWLNHHPYSFGLFFHNIVISTRFRLSLLLASLVLFTVGYFSDF
ncbi:MAG TPA: hypothetical protein VK040_03680 [Balneolaceae bacterium]|nr:hypothetical protein [Balneolaceae bacterium]